MIAANGYYIFTGRDGEVIPRHAICVHIHESLTAIPANAFYENTSIVEVVCHVDVKTVEEWAFAHCPSLRRVIMPGVEVVEVQAFRNCEALADVECGKLEIIGRCAFANCESLRSIDLPSVEFVGVEVFSDCEALTDVKFGKELERIEEGAFGDCRSLERITIPLKDGIITDDTFSGCENLKQVDLVEGGLHETIAALLFEDWKNDMYEEIDAINQMLPTVNAGSGWEWENDDNHDNGGSWDPGHKARLMRRWIRSVLCKIIHYQAEHQRLLDEEVATTLRRVLPQDILTNNVLPFLELPLHTFEMEEDSEEEDDMEGQSERSDEDNGSDEASVSISEEELRRIRENDPRIKMLHVEGNDDSDIQNMTDKDWEQLGRYVSNHTHLTQVYLLDGALDDHRVSFFFQRMTRNSSIITHMDLGNNGLSVLGVRSMVPFLQNANSLTHLCLDDNNIQSEGFNLLLSALRDSPIYWLSCERCGIEWIEIDTTHILRHLGRLNLGGNLINAIGCRELAKLIHGGDATLDHLSLRDNKVDDNGVEILVKAVQANTKLTRIDLKGNHGISRNGQIMIWTML